MAVYCGLVKRSIAIIVAHEDVMPMVTDLEHGSQVSRSRSPEQLCPLLFLLPILALLQVKLINVKGVKLEPFDQFPSHL